MKHLLFLLVLLMLLVSCKKDESDDTQKPNKPVTPTGLYREGSGVTDVDGNIYRTVIIKISSGPNKSIVEQEWMMQNLRAKKYPDGTEIDEFFIIQMGYCNNDSTTVDSLGILYKWDALMKNSTLPGSQGACPNGWHIPTIEEFNALINGLGGNSVAGKKMKSTNSAYWNDVANSDNSSGFNAHGTGWASGQSMIFHYLNATMFWTSTEDGNNARVIQLNSDEIAFNQYTSSKSTKISCRCIKD